MVELTFKVEQILSLLMTQQHEHLQLLHALLAHDADLASELVRHNINSGLGNVENTVMRLVSRSYLEQS